MEAHFPHSTSMALPLPVELTHAEPHWLKGLLSATLVFNLVDVVFTLIVVLLGLAVEANPVMDRALQAGPLVFTLIKITVVSIGVTLLWRERTRPLALVGSVGIFLAYASLMVYHAHWLVRLLA